MSKVKSIVTLLSEIGKQTDTQKVLTELEEVEKAVKYVKKVALRKHARRIVPLSTRDYIVGENGNVDAIPKEEAE